MSGSPHSADFATVQHTTETVTWVTKLVVQQHILEQKHGTTISSVLVFFGQTQVVSFRTFFFSL